MRLIFFGLKYFDHDFNYNKNNTLLSQKEEKQIQTHTNLKNIKWKKNTDGGQTLKKRILFLKT